MVVQQKKGISWTTKRLSKRKSQVDSYKEIGKNLERSYKNSDSEKGKKKNE